MSAFSGNICAGVRWVAVFADSTPWAATSPISSALRRVWWSRLTEPNTKTRRPTTISRTQWLQGQGYRVLRFTNTEVWAELEAVLEEIRRHLHSKRPTAGSSPTAVPSGTGRPSA